MSRFRRTATGCCLIAGPLFLLAANVLGSRGPTTFASYLDALAARPVANEVSIVLALYGFVLMVPTVIGLAHLLGDRVPIVGNFAIGLLLLGFVSFAFVAGTEYTNIAMADPAADRAQMVALNDRVGASVGYNLINGTEVIGFLLGTILAAVAVYRARIAPWIVPLLIGAGVALRFFGAASWIAVLAGDTMAAAGYAYLGLKLIHSSQPIPTAAAAA